MHILHLSGGTHLFQEPYEFYSF